MTTEEAALPARRQAAERLHRARTMQDAAKPVKRYLDVLDEETRSAAVEASRAGFSEQDIAASLGAPEDAVHAWLAGRSSGPVPPPSPATETWLLHSIAQLLSGSVARLRGIGLPDQVKGRYVASEARNAQNHADDLVFSLSALGAGLDLARERR